MKFKVALLFSVLFVGASLPCKSEIQQREIQTSQKRSEMLQLEQRQVWDNVVAINTIEAYQKYLKENPTSIYRQEAENAIYELQGGPAWERIKDTNNIGELENFVESYPNATARQQAIARIHELKGVLHYNNGNLDDAYSEFYQIDRDKMSYANRKAYDGVMEYHEFSALGEYPSETSLFEFLRKYPESKYATYVSNMIAVAKARNLSDFASQYDYDQALSFAKDADTKKVVQSYISENKKLRKRRLNAIKSNERRNNGGLVNLGVEFLDLGYNCKRENGSALYYNAGLFSRFGNYADRVQFAIGLTPGVFSYDRFSYDYDYDGYASYVDSEKSTEFHLPLLGQLKLNLCKLSDTSRLFLYGQYQYNAVRVKEIESEMSWGAGFGFGWKYFDWLFYYRQDVGKPSIFYDKQFYIGTSMIIYIPL